eukprot:235266-Amphidinium_carterae.1
MDLHKLSTAQVHSRDPNQEQRKVKICKRKGRRLPKQFACLRCELMMTPTVAFASNATNHRQLCQQHLHNALGFGGWRTIANQAASKSLVLHSRPGAVCVKV